MNRDANIVYRLNSQDEFIYINEEWTNFAIANDASDLLREHVLFRPLWDFISDETTKQLYREILLLVRAGRSTTFTFRCDAPEYRRQMEMTIISLGDGVVQFEISSLQVEKRLRQGLLDRSAPRADNLLRICGWCNRVDVDGGKWLEIDEAVTALNLFEREVLPLLTHGICGACLKSMRETIAKP
jgi:hypothetical protein